MGLSYGAAPTPDEPAEAVRVAEPDMHGHYYRHAACDRPVGSHGRGCFTVQDLHRIGADVLLAALGHTDCVPREQYRGDSYDLCDDHAEAEERTWD